MTFGHMEMMGEGSLSICGARGCCETVGIEQGGAYDRQGKVQ